MVWRSNSKNARGKNKEKSFPGFASLIFYCEKYGSLKPAGFFRNAARLTGNLRRKTRKSPMNIIYR